MNITKTRVKKWDVSLLKRAKKLGARVFSYGEFQINIKF